MELLLHILVRLLLSKEITAAVDKVSSTLWVLALRHVVVSGGELAARICILLVLRCRGSTTRRPHLNVSRHIAHYVLLVRVLLHRVHLPDRLSHLSRYNFGLLHSIVETCRRDRSLLTCTVVMSEWGCIGTDWSRILWAKWLPWIKFLRKSLVLLVHGHWRSGWHSCLVYLASIVRSSYIHWMTWRVGPSHYVGMINTLGFLSLKDIRDVSLVLGGRLQAF